MKIALCLHGLYGGINDKKKRKILGSECHLIYYHELISKYDVDVFIHSWTLDKKDEIISKYKPLKYIIENQINFDNRKTIKIKKRGDHFYFTNMYSNFYSLQICNNLKKEYELEKKITYDCVIHSRFDLMIKIIDDLNKLDLNNIYFPKIMKNPHYYVDYMFISNSENMDLFSDLYNHIEEYFPELQKMTSQGELLNHRLVEIHMKKIDLLDDKYYLENKFINSMICTDKHIKHWINKYGPIY